jgi:hypothetical protein
MNDLKFAVRQLAKKSNPPEPRSFGRFELGRESVSPGRHSEKTGPQAAYDGLRSTVFKAIGDRSLPN